MKELSFNLLDFVLIDFSENSLWWQWFPRVPILNHAMLNFLKSTRLGKCIHQSRKKTIEIFPFRLISKVCEIFFCSFKLGILNSFSILFIAFMSHIVIKDMLETIKEGNTQQG